MGLLSPGYPDECDHKLVIAAHEVGHGVADWANGLTVRYVRLEFGVFGGVGGRAKVKEQPIPNKKVAGYAVSCLAGAEAEAQFLARHYGVGTGKARRIADVGLTEGRDWDEFKRAAKHAGLSHSEGKHRAEQVVTRHWGKIQRLATKLARSHKLTSWDF